VLPSKTKIRACGLDSILASETTSSGNNSVSFFQNSQRR